MKQFAVAVAVLGLLSVPLTEPVSAETNINVSVGLPIKVGSGSGSVFFSLSTAPEFIEPAPLGFYTAVGVPYNGPWFTVERRHLPPGLRKYKHDRIRYYRDVEYRHYRDDHEHYSGRRYRPEPEKREEIRNERHERRDDLSDHRREQRDVIKDERREMREERKDEKWREKEERRDDRGEGRSHGR